MSKLTARKQYLASGNRIISAYQVLLQKIATENAGFNENDELNIQYFKNKIVITKKT
jgi:hypothetical protein